jgi:deoxyadenosine/deoxycytidine kinase
MQITGGQDSILVHHKCNHIAAFVMIGRRASSIICANRLGKFVSQRLLGSEANLQPFLISIEGNIGAGKSTLIEEIKKHNTDWNFIAEPVDIWSSITNVEGKSLLSLYYEDPKRWSYSFQSCALLSRFQNIQKALAFAARDDSHLNQDGKGSCVPSRRPVFITERCLDTDYNVFAKLLRDEGSIDKLEFEIYDRLYQHLRESMTASLTAIIHVDTSPEDCMDRIKIRNRIGESAISLDYLHSIDRYQNNWTKSLNNVAIIKTRGLSTRSIISEIDVLINMELVSPRDQKFYNVCL